MALESITGMPSLPITGAARAAIPPAPKGYMGPRELAPVEEEIGSELLKAKQKVGEADIGIEKAKREEQARGFETKAIGLKKEAEEIELMPEKQALKELREKERGMEFIPTKDTVQDVAGLFGLISVIGMVVGKKNAQMAMGNMNAMLEGHRKGRADLVKKEALEFDKNFKAMQVKVAAGLNEFQEALERRKSNKEAGQLLEQAALLRMESPLLKAIYDKQGPIAVVERLKEIQKSATQTAPQLVNQLQTAADARAATAAREAARERQHKEDMAQRERSHRETIAAANERARLSREKPEKPATRKETLPLIQGIRSVEKLQEDLRDPEIRTGLIAKAAPLLEKIASLRPDKNFEEGVNQTLTGTDKTTVFLKNALLNSYAIERAASGGGRLTVAMMRQAGPVLDPTNYTPQAYSQILEDRRKEFYENLQDYGFTPEQISETTSPRPYQPFGGGAPAPASSNIDTERSSAKAAIAAGAPEAKVKERFKQKTGQEL